MICFFISSIHFFTIRYHGSSSSIKCHVCHHVGGRRHTPVVYDDSRKPHTSHFSSRPVATKTNQHITHTSHYPSRPVEIAMMNGFSKKAAMMNGFSKKAAMINGFSRNYNYNKFLQKYPCCSKFLERGRDVRHQPFGRQKFQPISATIMSPKCLVD